MDDVVHLSYPSLFKSSSSSTLTERMPLNGSDPRRISSRPSRPRGMTDGGSTWSPQSIPDFLRGASLPPQIPSLPSSPTSFNTHPRVLVRQPSASRVGPPGAPPSRNLPAPPSKTYRPGQEAEPLPGSSADISSTSVVPSSRELLLNQIVTRSIDQEWDRVSISSKSSAGHTIRKAISHQSFSKRTSNLPSSSTIADGMAGDRALRKQRSFHHTSRSILPPLPMPPWNPPPVPPQPQPLPSETLPNAEEYKDNPPAPSGRKRLFSGGSTKRPSSQIFSPGGDDHQPVSTSGPAQEDRTSTSSLSGRSDSPALSARNEALSDPPLTSLDYTPKRIISPLEMLRIEAEHLEQLEEHNVGTPRERAHSFTSISTSTSRNIDYLQLPGTPKHYVVNPKSNLPGGADHSSGDPGTSSSPRHTIRLSASQTNMSRQGSPSPSPTHSSFPCLSPGLPPPPRPRLKSGNSEHESSIVPLSPRPLRRRDSKASTRSQPVRSIMKKPSFLVIDDERQRQSIPVLSNFAGSFLDLERGKESFDTIRSEDEREG